VESAQEGGEGAIVRVGVVGPNVEERVGAAVGAAVGGDEVGAMIHLPQVLGQY
jgi:hypothetical protein